MKRTIISLAAVAALGMATIATAQESVTTRDIYPEWNLTMITVDTTAEYAANDPCPDGHQTTAIWYFQHSGVDWQVWFPDAPEASDFTEFDANGSYWIYCGAE